MISIGTNAIYFTALQAFCLYRTFLIFNKKLTLILSNLKILRGWSLIKTMCHDFTILYIIIFISIIEMNIIAQRFNMTFNF